MPLLGILFVACMALAVLRSAIVALILALVLLLVWGALFRTREMLGTLTVWACCSFLDHHPIAAVISLAMVALVGLVGRLAGSGAK